MTVLDHRRGRADALRPRPRLVLAERGDALVPFLSIALRERYDVVAEIDVELTRAQRVLVAATTFRPRRRDWAERFFKSNLAVVLRSRRAASALKRTRSSYDLVLQTHALFEVTGPRTVLYVDCTHRQAAEQWPAWNPLGRPGLALWLRRERRQYHAAAHVFAFSSRTRDSLVDEYSVPADRVSVVGAGVNFASLPPVRRSRDRARTILFVGHDFRRKGGAELLEAFALLRRRIPDARLVLVGDPPPGADAPGVEFVGRVADRAQMSALYACADVFCLPSHFDPFPLVLLEAMAHGLPCVVTPTVGVPEIVDDGVTGLSVPAGPSLPISLVGALGVLLEDADLARRMGAAGRRRVEERFLWHHVLDRMAPVVARLAPTRSDQGPGGAPSVTVTAAQPSGALEIPRGHVDEDERHHKDHAR